MPIETIRDSSGYYVVARWRTVGLAHIIEFVDIGSTQIAHPQEKHLSGTQIGRRIINSDCVGRVPACRNSIDVLKHVLQNSKPWRLHPPPAGTVQYSTQN